MNSFCFLFLLVGPLFRYFINLFMLQLVLSSHLGSVLDAVSGRLELKRAVVRCSWKSAGIPKILYSVKNEARRILAH